MPSPFPMERVSSHAQADAAVVQTREWQAEASTGVEAAVLEAPAVMNMVDEEEFREHYLEIREARSGQIVTTLEMLSPSNKRSPGEGRRQYLAKRQACVAAGRNLVEIDLLRAGARLPMREPWPEGAYYILLARGAAGGRCEVWPIGLRDPLPDVPVPLAAGERDLAVSLQPLLRAVQDRSRYESQIDYERPLSPPLPPEDEHWLHDLLVANGLRSR